MRSPTPALSRRLVAGALAALVLVPGLASAGFITGVGPSRLAHLADAGNGLTVTVGVNETLDSYVENHYVFTLAGSPPTLPQGYIVEVAISPDDPDTRAAWNATALVGSGASSIGATVAIPLEQIRGTLANTPFRFSLRSSNGTLLDSVETSIDVRWRTPPADGGLLQLALATTAFWALVFLYALHLHSNERKLRARADALERSLQGANTDDPAHGSQR